MILAISLLVKIIFFFLVIAALLVLLYYFAIARPTDRQVKKSHPNNDATDSDIREWDDVLRIKN